MCTLFKAKSPLSYRAIKKLFWKGPLLLAELVRTQGKIIHVTQVVLIEMLDMATLVLLPCIKNIDLKIWK